MQTVSTIGLDIAKSVFQVHGVGQVVIRVADPKTFDQIVTCRSDRDGAQATLERGSGQARQYQQNRVTAICTACLWPAHSPFFAMRRCTVPSIGPGSRRYSLDGRPNLRLSRLSTSLLEWPGQ